MKSSHRSRRFVSWEGEVGVKEAIEVNAYSPCVNPYKLNCSTNIDKFYRLASHLEKLFFVNERRRSSINIFFCFHTRLNTLFTVEMSATGDKTRSMKILRCHQWIETDITIELMNRGDNTACHGRCYCWWTRRRIDRRHESMNANDSNHVRPFVQWMKI